MYEERGHLAREAGQERILTTRVCPAQVRLIGFRG